MQSQKFRMYWLSAPNQATSRFYTPKNFEVSAPGFDAPRSSVSDWFVNDSGDLCSIGVGSFLLCDSLLVGFCSLRRKFGIGAH